MAIQTLYNVTRMLTLPSEQIFSSDERTLKARQTKKWGICGRKTSKEEYETYNGLCWECWDDRMTEEIDTTE